MNNVIKLNAQKNTIAVTMTSLELMSIINQLRTEAGESAHEPRKFLLKVEDELDGELTGKNIRLNNNQTETVYYTLTMDQATLIGMRESKAVRRNVLLKLKDLEQGLTKPVLPDFSNPVIAARAWADEVEQKQIALAKIEEDKPKVEFVNAIESSKNAINVGTFARLLSIKGMGQNNLFKWLRKEGYLMEGGKTHNQPYQQYIEAGWFEIKESVHKMEDENVVAFTTLVTGRGQTALTKKLLEQNKAA